MSKRRSPGEGSVYERKDGRWVVAMPNPDPAGKPLVSYFKTEPEAKAEYKRLLKLKEAGIKLGADRETLEKFLDRWLEVSVKPHVRESTYAAYTRTIKKHITPELGPKTLASLRREELQRFINTLSEKLAPSTVSTVYARLITALEEAVNWEILARNPARSLRLPHARKTKAVTFSVDQAHAYLRATEGHRLEALFAVALSLGLRRGEMLGLMWEDIDFDARVIHVRHNLQNVSGKLVITPPKNESSEADVFLPQGLSRKLWDHLHRQMAEREIAGERWHDQGLVFPNVSGGPLWPNALWLRHQAFLKKAKLPKMKLHDLRKSCATLLHAQGISDKEIQAILRHASPLMTSQVYIQDVPALQQQAIERLDDLLFGEK